MQVGVTEAKASQLAFAAAIALQLRQSRRRQRLTQSAVSERTGGAVSKAALANYEAGHRSLRIDVFWALAKALGEDPAAMISAAERASGYGAAIDEGPVTVDVAAIEASDDERLAPVRRWFAMRMQTATGRLAISTLTLDHGALSALAALMNVTVTECRQLLADTSAAGTPPLEAREAS